MLGRLPVTRRGLATLAVLLGAAPWAHAQPVAPVAPDAPPLPPGPPPASPSTAAAPPAAFDVAPPPSAAPPSAMAPAGPPPPVYYGYSSPGPGYGYPGGQYPPPPYAPPPPQPEVARGAYRHDGFYLRLGLGIGRLGATFESSDSVELGRYAGLQTAGAVEGSLAAVAGAFELAIGGTAAPGLVIGGGIFSSATGKATTSDLAVDGRGVGNLQHDSVSFGLLGPFVDYYFDERRGFHLQGALGIAFMDVAAGQRNDVEVSRRRTLGGLGFMLGGGYEWFIAEQWSLGGVARLRYGALETDRKNDDERWTYATLAVPEILFTATYH